MVANATNHGFRPVRASLTLARYALGLRPTVVADGDQPNGLHKRKGALTGLFAKGRTPAGSLARPPWP